MDTREIPPEAVLLFVIKCGQVLLARMSPTAKIGANRWNGYGGGIKPNETAIDAVIREFREESGATAIRERLKKVAVVDFHNHKADNTCFDCRVHVFTTDKYEGKIHETEEMLTPTWYEHSELPKLMMAADPIWVPQILAGKMITAEVHYGPEQKSLLEPVHIDEVTSFP